MIVTGTGVVAHAQTAEPVKGDITVDTSAGYARLIFRMGEQVDVDARLSGNILILAFPKPVTLPIEVLSANARDYISVARRDPDGAGIRIALARKLRLNKQMAGERIYIDLLPVTWAGELPGLPQDVVGDLARRAREAERKLRQQQPAERAVPLIRVKVGAQPTFVRYIFDLPEGVTVNTEKSAEKLTLKFSKPVNYDLADTREGLPPALEGIDSDLDSDFSAINFRFSGPPEVRAFREDRQFVVDVNTRGSQADAPNDAAPPAAEKLPGLQAPETVPANGAAEPPKAAGTPAAAVMSPSPAKEHVKEAVPAAPTVAPAKLSEASPTPAAVPPPASHEMPKVADAPVAAPAEAPRPAAAIEELRAEMPPISAAPESAGKSGSAPIKVELRREGETSWLVFPFVNQTPSAVFRRDDTLWLVFDTAEKFDLSALDRDSGRTFRSAAVTRPDDATAVVRLKLDRPRSISLVPAGVGWAVSLGDKTPEPSRGLTIARNIIGQRSSMTVPFEDPRTLHRLTDPDFGDELMVITSVGPARGFPRVQEFVELRALASVHGVVVQPLADDLVAELGADKIVMSRPTGLTLSNAITPAAATASRTTMLDAQLWGFDRQANFNDRQSELIAKAAAAPASKKMAARLDVARFYLARDMYPEAKAVLDVALSDEKATAEDVTGVVLRAVSNVMLERPDDALKDLTNPLVGKQFDAPIWRALALSDQGHWPEARESFRDVQPMIAALPVELQRLALVRSIKASLEVKDYPGASRQLSEFETIGVPEKLEPTIAVLSGRAAQGIGNDLDAIKFYHQAADSSDRGVSAQGRLRELLVRYGKGEVNRSDMILELETLSSSWRGDETEIESLQWLSRLYTEENRYRDAFRVMRAALMSHPNSQKTQQIHDEAAASFENLFLAGRSDTMPPVEALGLFYDYRELTPIGRRGDEMIRRLADRLASVDLLDQAAELLQHQVDHRLQGAARAQVATRLAVIYLMNRKADRALATLRATRSGDLANELRTQRLLIEARALSDVGRAPLALEVIEKMTGREAMRLRADILWNTKRWGESAEQIEKLYGDRWKEFAPLTADERPDILRAGIGYALGDDTIGLARLRERYGTKMAEGPDRRAFEVVTAPSGTGDAEFAKIADTVSSYDTLSGFLKEMRARYPETGALARPASQERDSDPPATNSIRNPVLPMPPRQRGASLTAADLTATGSIAPRRSVVLPRPRPALP
jgi:tetratricopeptide (TPR) repeat protein